MRYTLSRHTPDASQPAPAPTYHLLPTPATAIEGAAMPTFCLTFGMRYAREPHPTLPRDLAHPDGWLKIKAPNAVIARALAAAITTPAGETTPRYAFLYAEADFAKSKRLYPRGCLGVLALEATGGPPPPPPPVRSIAL